MNLPTPAARPYAPLLELSEHDLNDIVAIDASLTARSRRMYYQRRLDGSRTDPGHHIQLGIEQGGRIAGFMIGRLLEGEFGRSEPAARLEALGVLSEAQH